MALRMFIYMAGGFVGLGFASFFAKYELEKEPVIVFVIAMTICLIALAIFIYTNRRLFNQITLEPSAKNVEIFMQTARRQKGSNGKDKTESDTIES